MLFCGSLPWIESDADDDAAKYAATGLVSSLCTEFFGLAVDVAWRPNGRPGSWTGTVFRVDGQPM
jgi:hypothetical protein